MATVPDLSRAIPRRQYPWIPLCIAALVLVGFAQTYYLKLLFGTPALPLLVHLHGLLMTAWVLLFVVQARLVATRNVPLHRRLGIIGVVLLVLIPVVSAVVAVHGAKLGHSPGPPPLVFLTVPLFNVAAFAILGGTGVLLRRRHSDWHRRLMLLATLNLLPPPMGRFAAQYLHAPGLPFAFGVADLAIIACLVYDTVKHRRLHPAFGWGLALVLTWEGAALALGGTAGWLHFAGWLTQLG
jgi:hypothetical protein